MLVLGIESSTAQASVTISSEQGIIASTSVARGLKSSEFLLPGIKFLLDQSDLSFRNLSAVAVGLGPGLFTSLRTGVATAKTLAQTLSIPVVGVSSLDVLAFEARYSSKNICAVTDAKRKEMFYAFYRSAPGGVNRVSEYQVGSARRLLGEIEARRGDTLLFGYGALLYKRELVEADRVEFGTIAAAFPSASSLIELALPRLTRADFDGVFDLEPLYMRRSDAEINWESKRSK